MSVRRIVRFFLGVCVAAVLLAIVLPYAGIPASHFLPPSYVYSRAQGETRGFVTGKYYEETGNPFHVGAHNYYINYSFKAPAPPPRGVTTPGPKQEYTGTVRVDEGNYGQFGQQQQSSPPAGQVIPLPPYPIKIKYEKTYPDINGVDTSWAQSFQNGRSIGAGSNVLSGWLIWVVVAVVLGYFLAMLLENVMKREDI